MVLPRMLALAEAVWSSRERRDWGDFIDRLGPHFDLLADLGVNYRIPHVDGLSRDVLTLDGRADVVLRSLMPEAEIRYTTDGTDPTPRSAVYDRPLTLTVDEEGTVVTARVFLPNGRASAPRSARYRRATLRPAEAMAAASLGPGVRYRYYEFEEAIRSVDGLDEIQPVVQGTVSAIEIGPEARSERFGYVFEGFVDVPADAIYTVAVTSDDGSRLWIGDELVVDHDGPHGATEKQGMIALAAGLHPIRVAFFQSGGGKALAIAVRREGVSGDVASRFLHRP
jgi:hexosaminidase